MKIAVDMGGMPVKWTAERMFEAAKEAGFDGVEFSQRETGILTHYSTEEDYKKLKKLAEKYDLEICSVSSCDLFGTPLTSDDKSVREKAKDIVKKELEAASYFGCDTILVVPGLVTDTTDYETAMQRCDEWIAELKPLAESYKIAIGLENVWNKMLLSPLEMRDMIDRQNSEYVCSYFDVGNVVLNGFPEQWIKILGKRIKKVHFKDFSRKIGTASGFVPLLMGDTNYKAVSEALHSIGYDGWVTSENRVSADAPEASLLYTSTAMRKIISMAE